uniref:Rho GTPase activating protein 4a n=1 Tax=Oncorhynchus tshawytscha TaxID=74940 RepID=A0AAZ3SEF5_ONCTS
MTSHVKLRKERVGAVDYDTQIKEVRCQLVDQLKVLDLQLEQKSQQLQDLTDYLRRRSEIEGEYARSLDKLAERFTSKIKRKEPGSGQSVAQCWLVLLAQTRQESKDHSGVSDSCSTTLTQPLTHSLEITQRLAKRVLLYLHLIHLARIVHSVTLATAWRTYYQYHSEYESAEGKLKEAEKQKQGRQCKVQEIQLKCTKARNDYLLNLAAANASMNKYYLQDLSSLMDCSDIGYHLSLSRVLRSYLSSRSRAQQNLSGGLQQLHTAVSGLDQIQDRDYLLQTHTNTFCLPLRFHYQPHEGDQVCEVSAEQEIRCEMETRFQQLQSKLTGFTQETEEVQTRSNESLASSSSRPSLARRRANLQETETLYCNVKEYLCKSSLVSKLQAKHDLLKVAVEKGVSTPSRKLLRVRSKSQPSVQYTHKLFTGDMLSFIQASGQEIPVVVESCIRFINLNGLHHEGIFRVPGSQGKVNSLRDAFERGEDPVADSRCDLDSVAGVLKLYFRTLENPLFPQDSTAQLLEYAQIDNETERAAKLKSVISSYPPPVSTVMRYLFAFLHHVSQYSDENMMQPYNLAVCFGPSLLRGAQDDDVVTLQPQINSLVKSIILQHESIFPSLAELQGPMYEKCMTLQQDDCEEGEGYSEHHSKEGKGGPCYLHRCVYCLSHLCFMRNIFQLWMETIQLAKSDTFTEMLIDVHCLSQINVITLDPESESKGELSRANSSCSSRQSPVGGTVTPGGKFTLQSPITPQGWPLSPGYISKE